MWYESTTGKLLGPFDVGIYDDGSIGLWYRIPAMVAKYAWYTSDHVHGIVGDEIVSVEWPENGKIDPFRIRRVN